MSEIRFYHLQSARLENVLPVMLERAYRQNERVLVMAGSAERVEALNAHLWTYRPDSFLPHGSRRDGEEKEQPIYLTDRAENANAAGILMLCDNAEYPAFDEFRLVCLIFDGRDEAALGAARSRWRDLKAGGGHRLLYYQEDESGKWQERAAA